MNVYLFYQLMRGLNRWRINQNNLLDEREEFQHEVYGLEAALDAVVVHNNPRERMMMEIAEAYDSNRAIELDVFEDVLAAKRAMYKQLVIKAGAEYEPVFDKDTGIQTGERLNKKLTVAKAELDEMIEVVNTMKDIKEPTLELLQDLDRYNIENNKYFGGDKSIHNRMPRFDAKFSAKNAELSGESGTTLEFFISRSLDVSDKFRLGAMFEKFSAESPVLQDFFKSFANIANSHKDLMRKPSKSKVCVLGTNIHVGDDPMKKLLKNTNSLANIKGDMGMHAFHRPYNEMVRHINDTSIKKAKMGFPDDNRHRIYHQREAQLGKTTPGRYVSEKLVNEGLKDSRLFNSTDFLEAQLKLLSSLKSTEAREAKKAKIANAINRRVNDLRAAGAQEKTNVFDFDVENAKSLSDIINDEAYRDFNDNLDKMDEKEKIVKIPKFKARIGVLSDESGENTLETEANNIYSLTKLAQEAFVNAPGGATDLTIYMNNSDDYIRVINNPLKGLEFYSSNSQENLRMPHVDEMGRVVMPPGMKKLSIHEANTKLAEMTKGNEKGTSPISIASSMEYAAFAVNELPEEMRNPNLDPISLTKQHYLGDAIESKKSLIKDLKDIHATYDKLDDRHPMKVAAAVYLTSIDDLKAYKENESNKELLKMLEGGDIPIDELGLRGDLTAEEVRLRTINSVKEKIALHNAFDSKIKTRDEFLKVSNDVNNLEEKLLSDEILPLNLKYEESVYQRVEEIAKGDKKDYSEEIGDLNIALRAYESSLDRVNIYLSNIPEEEININDVNLGEYEKLTGIKGATVESDMTVKGIKEELTEAVKELRNEIVPFQLLQEAGLMDMDGNMNSFIKDMENEESLEYGKIANITKFYEEKGEDISDFRNAIVMDKEESARAIASTGLGRGLADGDFNTVEVRHALAAIAQDTADEMGFGANSTVEAKDKFLEDREAASGLSDLDFKTESIAMSYIYEDDIAARNVVNTKHLELDVTMNHQEDITHSIESVEQEWVTLLDRLEGHESLDSQREMLGYISEHEPELVTESLKPFVEAFMSSDVSLMEDEEEQSRYSMSEVHSRLVDGHQAIPNTKIDYNMEFVMNDNFINKALYVAAVKEAEFELRREKDFEHAKEIEKAKELEEKESKELSPQDQQRIRDGILDLIENSDDMEL